MVGLHRSDFTTCFISPTYLESPWCEMEYIESEILYDSTPNGIKRLRHNILPICWKRLYPGLEFGKWSKLKERRSIDVSKETQRGEWRAAVRKAVNGTIEFLELQYDLPPLGRFGDWHG